MRNVRNSDEDHQVVLDVPHIVAKELVQWSCEMAENADSVPEERFYDELADQLERYYDTDPAGIEPEDDPIAFSNVEDNMVGQMIKDFPGMESKRQVGTVTTSTLEGQSILTYLSKHYTVELDGVHSEGDATFVIYEEGDDD